MLFSSFSLFCTLFSRHRLQPIPKNAINNNKRDNYLLGVLEEPSLGGGGVGDGLLGGKSLGGNDEDGRLGLDLLKDLGNVSTINVRDKVDLETTLGGIGLQGLGDHDGAKIRSTDTNVDNVLNLVASITLPGARTDLLSKSLHMLKDGVDLGDNVLAFRVDGGVGNVAEGDVEDGAVLSKVDVFAREHLGAHFLDAGLLGEVDEVLEGVLGDDVLGEVEEDGRLCGGTLEVARELLEARGVLGKEVLHVDLVGLLVVVGLEGLPCAELVCEDHCLNVRRCEGGVGG